MVTWRAWSGGWHFQKHLSISSIEMSPWTKAGIRRDWGLKHMALKTRVSEE